MPRRTRNIRRTLLRLLSFPAHAAVSGRVAVEAKQLFRMSAPHLHDLALQGLAAFQLRGNEIMALRPIPLKPEKGFHFILVVRAGMPPGQAIPKTRHTFAEAIRTGFPFGILTFALHPVEPLAFGPVLRLHRASPFIERIQRIGSCSFRVRDIA